VQLGAGESVSEEVRQLGFVGGGALFEVNVDHGDQLRSALSGLWVCRSAGLSQECTAE
jgi:hypothetical protein